MKEATKDVGTGYLNNNVGPILRSGEVANAAIEAIQEDNPGKKFSVDDKVAYIRIHTDGECILRRATMESALGRPFKMAELEINLSSFAGRIENNLEYVRFYFEKTL